MGNRGVEEQAEAEIPIAKDEAIHQLSANREYWKVRAVILSWLTIVFADDALLKIVA